MAVGFVLLEVDVTLDDGCGMRTFALFQGSEMSPGLFRDFMDGVYKILILTQLLIELRVPNQGYSQTAGSQSVIITAGSQLAGPQFKCKR